MRGHPGVDALGAERHKHVLAGDQTAAAQRLDQQVLSASHIGGGGQHDRLPRSGHLDHRGAGPGQRGQVRDQMGVDRGRHADQNRVHRAQRARLRGQGQQFRAQEPIQTGAVGGEQVHLLSLDRGETSLTDVTTQHRDTGLGEAKGGGQPDVPEPDHTHQVSALGMGGQPGPGAKAGRSVGRAQFE